MKNEIVILNEDIGKPRQIEEAIKDIKNIINFNKEFYTFEQFVQLFSGEFRGLICYTKEKAKSKQEQNPWFKNIDYNSIIFQNIKVSRKSAYKISIADFLDWYNNTVVPNTVLITEEDYLFALKFSIACYIKMRQSPHGMAGIDRDMNQWISNGILGKLAEIGIAKHAKNFGYEIELAFDLWDLEKKSLQDYQYEKDIRKVNGKEPVFNIEIKATKYRSSFQDVSIYKTREAINEHFFNYLIQAKLTLPKIHLLNYLNHEILKQNFSSQKKYLNFYAKDEDTYNQIIQKYQWKDFPMYISGIISRENMFKIQGNKVKLPCLNQEVSNKYFIFSALLDNSKETFKNFYKSL